MFVSLVQITGGISTQFEFQMSTLFSSEDFLLTLHEVRQETAVCNSAATRYISTQKKQRGETKTKFVTAVFITKLKLKGAMSRYFSIF